MQLFTREKRETLAFHIMTKEIYPHSVLISQFNPSKQVCMKPSLSVQTLATLYIQPSNAQLHALQPLQTPRCRYAKPARLTGCLGGGNVQDAQEMPPYALVKDEAER